MADHKELTASAAGRWIHCPGSVREIAALPLEQRQGRSSWYADEGTAAHAVLRYCLSPLLEGGGIAPSLAERLVGGHVNHITSVVISPNEAEDPPSVHHGSGWWEITDEMAQAVIVGIDAVQEINDRLCGDQGLLGIEIQLENTWDMTWLHPKMGGTSDYKASKFLDELVVMDYKHGKGVVVEVDEYEFTLPGNYVIRANPQLLIYILGAAYEDQFSHEKYTAVVCQPRAPHPDGPTRSIIYTRAELLAFLEFIKGRAYATEELNAPLRAGKWCRWCPKSGNCEEQDRSVADAAGACFDDLPPEPGAALVVPENLALLSAKLNWIPLIKEWIKSVEANAIQAAVSGLEIPGRKLVEGRANRKLRDGGLPLFDAAIEAGLEADKIWAPREFRTPAQIEKLGKGYKKLIGAKGDDGEYLYTVKPKGKLSLVLTSDKRLPVDPLLFPEFTDLDEEEAENGE